MKCLMFQHVSTNTKVERRETKILQRELNGVTVRLQRSSQLGTRKKNLRKISVELYLRDYTTFSIGFVQILFFLSLR